MRFPKTVLLLLLLAFSLGGCWQGPFEPEGPNAQQIKAAREFFQQALEAKEISEKERLYIRALELYPAYPEAHNNLGDVYEKQGRYDEAIREYTLAAAFRPDLAAPYFGLGDVYFQLGRYEMAVANYKKGLRISPDDQAAKRKLELAEILTTRVLFPFNSAALNEQATKQLETIARALTSPELRGSSFEIQGHTDSTGPAGYNLKLSLARAESARSFLVKECGVEEERLTVRGYGEERPVASNKTEEGRQMNRRIEMVKKF